jgi:hypothetical protein
MPDIEPVLSGSTHRRIDRASSARLARAMSADTRDDGTAILELIGNDGQGKTAFLHATDDMESVNDVVQGLHAQYWRALTDPHASLSGSWIGQSDEQPTPTAAAADNAEGSRQSRGESDEARSLETLLSGECTLEKIFGRLESGANGTIADLEAEPVPEVLRLFAPPEYHAAVAGQTAALPPALTRREHHALSFDSPLATPVRKDEA